MSVSALTGPRNGRFVQVYVDGVVIAHATNHTFSPSRDMRDTTSKDSGGWRNVSPGLGSWTISADFLFAEDAGTGYSTLYSKMVNCTQVELEWSTEISTTKKYVGVAFVSELPQEAPNEDNNTFSVTFEGNGEPVEKTVT